MLAFFAFLWTLCTVCFWRSSLVEMSLGLDNSIENLCGIRALPIILQKNRVTRPTAVPELPKILNSFCSPTLAPSIGRGHFPLDHVEAICLGAFDKLSTRGTSCIRISQLITDFGHRAALHLFPAATPDVREQQWLYSAYVKNVFFEPWFD